MRERIYQRLEFAFPAFEILDTLAAELMDVPSSGRTMLGQDFVQTCKSQGCVHM
jgi:hypothetical protein